MIAVEGLCYAGKTTLARSLAHRVNAMMIGEYTDLASLPPFPPRHLDDVNTALEHFLRIEQHRARTARASGAPIVVLDRSPLTLIAHEHGMAAIGVPSDPVHAAEMYSTAAETGQILTPDGYLYLAIPGNVTAIRQTQRGPVAAHLMNQQARAAIDHTCRAWLAALPKGRYLELDGATTPPELTATATRWLHGIASGPLLPSWRTLSPPLGDG